MVIFVGDAPSSKNNSPEVPFVGTQSYKRLLEWIWELDVDLNHVVLANKRNVKKNDGKVWEFISIDLPGYYVGIGSEDKFIALGKNASEYLKDLKIEHFTLPHPSGRNRVLNDSKKTRKILKECKEYLR